MPNSALEQLQTRPYWVAYTMNARKEKMPLDPTRDDGEYHGGRAGDPGTWGSYEDAVNYWRKHHDYVRGIGREMMAEEGLVFIDLDDCRNPRTGAVTPLAARVLNSIHSYAQVSQSGTGIHILAYGDIPGSLGPDPKATRENEVEMYKEGRYFIWTGNHIEGTPPLIRNAYLSIYRLYWEIKDIRNSRSTWIPTSQWGDGDRTQNGTGYITEPSIKNYMQAVLDSQCHRVASCREGARNETLHNAAFILGQYVQYGFLVQSIVERNLSIAGIACGLAPHEVKRSLTRGLDAGMKSIPRNQTFLRLVEEAKQVQAVV